MNLSSRSLTDASFRLGRVPEAVQWYGKALELDPMRAVAYLNLGDAYFQMEKKGEAAKAYEKYLSMQPNSSRAAELKEKIDAAR